MALVIFDTVKGHKGDEIESLVQEIQHPFSDCSQYLAAQPLSTSESFSK